MDRLPTLTRRFALGALVIAAGCGESGKGPPPPSRVVAVGRSQQDPTANFCEVQRDGAQATPLVLPALAAGQVAPAFRGATWLNIWATWCRPCIEELPLIAAFEGRLRAAGVRTSVVLLAADESDEAVAAFRAQHPNTPVSLRVADPASLSTWVTGVGLDAGATLPIHILTDDQGRVRCARTGALGERDFDGLRGILTRIVATR